MPNDYERSCAIVRAYVTELIEAGWEPCDISTAFAVMGASLWATVYGPENATLLVQELEKVIGKLDAEAYVTLDKLTQRMN